MLEIALDCVRRGWAVFPCVPRAKRPLSGLVPHGVNDASKDEETIRRWWRAKPGANVGIACGPSGIAVLDCDHGNQTDADYRAWSAEMDLPQTFTVRTGRRTGFGTQSYFRVYDPVATGGWSVDGHKGEVRCRGALVIAAGSIHPSGERYEVLIDAPLAP